MNPSLLLFDPQVFHMPGRHGMEGAAQAAQTPVCDECDDPWHKERDVLVLFLDLGELTVVTIQIFRIDGTGHLIEQRIYHKIPDLLIPFPLYFILGSSGAEMRRLTARRVVGSTSRTERNRLLVYG